MPELIAARTRYVAAPIARIIALTALTTLDYLVRHSTTHSTTHLNERYVALPCAERAPPFGVADNGGAPNNRRAQNRSVCRVMVWPGFGQDYRTVAE